MNQDTIMVHKTIINNHIRNNTKTDLTLTLIHCWGMTSGLLHRAVGKIFPYVSKKRTAFNSLTERRSSSDVYFVFKWLACTCTNAHDTQSVRSRRLFVLLGNICGPPHEPRHWLGGYCTAVNKQCNNWHCSCRNRPTINCCELNQDKVTSHVQDFL